METEKRGDIMLITVENYKKFQQGKIKGVCDIAIDIEGAPMTIKGIKIIDNSQNGHFYSLPTKEYTEKNTGERKYTPICAFFTKQGYQTFHISMNSAFKIYFNKNPQDPKDQSYAQPKVNTQSQEVQSYHDDTPF
jgi:hypothetical protein